MGQCMSFNALGLVRTAKIVLHGHLYRCQSVYRETSWIAHFYVVFACGFEQYETSPTSNNADLMSLFCKDSDEQFGRRDNIRSFGVEEFNEDVNERVIEVAKDIGVTISKQDISV